MDDSTDSYKFYREIKKLVKTRKSRIQRLKVLTFFAAVVVLSMAFLIVGKEYDITGRVVSPQQCIFVNAGSVLFSHSQGISCKVLSHYENIVELEFGNFASLQSKSAIIIDEINVEGCRIEPNVEIRYGRSGSFIMTPCYLDGLVQDFTLTYTYVYSGMTGTLHGRIFI
ncbi:MAG: hypothetical protein KKF44_06635 [Nanoarchaeota archaeon]|nr:hypothetical protein [Nanoarchaeota archaeon]